MPPAMLQARWSTKEGSLGWARSRAQNLGACCRGAHSTARYLRVSKALVDYTSTMHDCYTCNTTLPLLLWSRANGVKHITYSGSSVCI